MATIKRLKKIAQNIRTRSKLVMSFVVVQYMEDVNDLKRLLYFPAYNRHRERIIQAAHSKPKIYSKCCAASKNLKLEDIFHGENLPLVKSLYKVI